jgi:hypothetical protein
MLASPSHGASHFYKALLVKSPWYKQNIIYGENSSTRIEVELVFLLLLEYWFMLFNALVLVND